MVKQKYTTAFGKWIDDYCEIHSISIEELCRRAGLNRDAVYRFARGDTKTPDHHTIQKLAAYTGELRSLLLFAGYDLTPLNHVQQITNEERVTLEKIRMLKGGKRQLLNALIIAMLAEDHK